MVKPTVILLSHDCRWGIQAGLGWVIFQFHVVVTGGDQPVSGLVWLFEDSLVQMSGVLVEWLEGWAWLVISLSMLSQGLSVWFLEGGVGSGIHEPTLETSNLKSQDQNHSWFNHLYIGVLCCTSINVRPITGKQSQASPNSFMGRQNISQPSVGRMSMTLWWSLIHHSQ